MAKEIQLCLVYRDMWQSSGKYMPRVEQLEQVAQAILRMNCFQRVETNGGGFEQIQLLAGQNPNVAVRRWTQAFNDAGVQTQMLERGINALSMSAVGADVRQLLFRVKKKQGTDISRSFDGLNNPQNLALSFQYAREGGMIAQGALSITHSPLHTVDYYLQLADQYIELGAQEICIKDMAGVGRPTSIGKIVRGIRQRHPDILIQYHGHSTPGFSVVSSLEAARAGANFIDVGMEPLSWGTGHADLLTVHAMLKDDGFSLPDINTAAYMETRSLSQSFIDDFLGYYIDPQNRMMNSLLIGPGLPGGMMGSLMADLNNNLASLNKWLAKNNQAAISQQSLLLRLFEEVEYAWPKLGYPPLVTPYSQYVKNLALMNALQIIKGKERWSMIDENTWAMILGRSGQLLGELGAEIKALALAQGREFYHGNPQDLYPDELAGYRQKMQEKGWLLGDEEEELLEYALHPQQYEAFQSGQAKAKFEEDLAKQRAKAQAGTEIAAPAPTTSLAPALAANINTPNPLATNPPPKNLTITVDGKAYKVGIRYEQESASTPAIPTTSAANSSTGSSPTLPPAVIGEAATAVITAPLEGKFFLTRDAADKAITVGDTIRIGDPIGYIEAMKVINAVTADKAGRVLAIEARHGEEIGEDDVIIRLA